MPLKVKLFQFYFLQGIFPVVYAQIEHFYLLGFYDISFTVG